MWVPYPVTAAGVCCLVLLLAMSETTEGFKSRLEHNNNAASYSRAFESKMNIVGADDNHDDDDDDDDDADSSDGGMEKLGFMDEDDGNDDDGDVYGFLEEDDDDDDELEFMAEDDGDVYSFLEEDDNDDDDDGSDDGMEKLGFMDEDNGNDDDGDEHGAIQEHRQPSKDYINELLKDENKDKKKNNKKAAVLRYSLRRRYRYWLRRVRLRHRNLLRRVRMHYRNLLRRVRSRYRYLLRRSYIHHGTRIVLQWKPYSRYWLDCGTSSHHLCRKSVCPGMYFDSSDSRRCSGVFFNIYRHRGPGVVRNGDIMALYNPTRRQWFGCRGRYCGRGSCPGRVNYRFGFYNHRQWLRCYGEVFRIYARNKGVGAAITEQDQVALYYLQQHTWVRGSGSRLYKSRCMGTTRPPHNSRFEHCYRSTFEIHKR